MKSQQPKIRPRARQTPGSPGGAAEGWPGGARSCPHICGGHATAKSRLREVVSVEEGVFDRSPVCACPPSQDAPSLTRACQAPRGKEHSHHGPPFLLCWGGGEGFRTVLPSPVYPARAPLSPASPVTSALVYLVGKMRGSERARMHSSRTRHTAHEGVARLRPQPALRVPSCPPHLAVIPPSPPRSRPPGPRWAHRPKTSHF